MAGRRLNRDSYHARAYAHAFLSESQDIAKTTQSFALGPARLDVQYHTQDWLSELILGAFLPEKETAEPVSAFTLSITRSHEAKSHPDFTWLMPQIELNLPFRQSVSYPYRIFFDKHQGLTYVYNTQTQHGAIRIRRDSELDLRSFITPFRLMLSWMANHLNAEIVHGAAVSTSNTGILLSGGSGSGKSTLALAAIGVGLFFLADDCVMIHDTTMHAVYRRAKKVPDTAGSAFDFTRIPQAPRAKEFLDVTTLGSSFSRLAPLDGIVYPVIRSTSGMYPVSQQQSVLMLTTDSLREIFGGGKENGPRLRKIATSVPGYRLLLGNNETTPASVNTQLLLELLTVVKPVMTENASDASK